ncbi:MAG TPA: methyl-accepting chemotaxis protein [Pyrinomonadaceae bacterium]|nr:methyl-accepting chemotaxis protein [Pyrinomonadaceae bacterium]
MFKSLKHRILAGFAAAAAANFLYTILIEWIVSKGLMEQGSAFWFLATGYSLISLFLGYLTIRSALSPLTNLTLFAKSLERNPSSTPPKSPGAIELDELHFTLQRTGRQLHHLVGLMEEVASGNTAAADTPIENLDRLSAAFQKLVAKVSESISAKQQLENLQKSIVKLTSDANKLKVGTSIEARAESLEVSELTSAINAIAKNAENRKVVSEIAAGEIAESVKTIFGILKDVGKYLESSAARAENASIELSRLLSKSGDYSSPLASLLNDPALDEPAGKESSVRSAEVLTGEMAEIRRMLKKHSERITALNSYTRTAQDIARRSHLVALNTTLADDQGLDIENNYRIVEELTLITERGAALGYELGSFTDSLGCDFAELDRAIKIVESTAVNIASEIRELIAHEERVCETVSTARERINTLRQFHNDLVAAITSSRQCLLELAQSAALKDPLLQAEKCLLTINASLSRIQNMVSDNENGLGSTIGLQANRGNHSSLEQENQLSKPTEIGSDVKSEFFQTQEIK